MKTPESDKHNQQRCKHCGRIVGCDYRGRKHKCGCTNITPLDACKLVERAWCGDGIDMSTAVDACLLAIENERK